jgi:AcrR family transcriptional regulator
MTTVNPVRRAEIAFARRSRTRLRLLDAAARVLAEHGETAASIELFIEAAGVARGTFYNYFDNRDAVIDALWQQVGANPFHSIQRACEPIADPAARLATACRLVIRRAELDHAWGWLVIHLATSRRIMSHELAQYPGADLQAGLEAGRFRFADLDAARDLVVATTIAGMKGLLKHERGKEYPEALAAMIMLALGVRRGETQALATLPLPSTDWAIEPPRRRRGESYSR